MAAPTQTPAALAIPDALPNGRRAHILHIDVDAPRLDQPIPEYATDVLVIVHHGDAVIGQSWLPGQPAPRPEAIWEAVRSHGTTILRSRTRALVETALGRDQLSRAAVTTPLSLIVCTRDRGPQLRVCLESLLALKRPVELLVVDNGSSDELTGQICDELGVRWVSEPKPGQTSARNRGIRETSGELIAFTDDDVTVDPDWLAAIEDEFEDPLTMVATGYIGPRELDHETQVQFEAHGGFERHAERRVFSSSTGTVIAGAAMAGAGANMIVRRTLFERIGGFDEEFGAGTPTRTADDKMLFYRALEAGYRIRYSPARKVWHQHRRDHDALLKIMRDYGTGEFTWTGYVLRTRRDLGALPIWKWWLRHFAADVRRYRRGGPHAVPLDLTASEVRGVLAAPKALRTVGNERPAGGAGPEGPWRAAAPAPASPPPVRGELPKLSVTIASYNRRDALASALQHLAQQDFPADQFEVIVVLDGCTDGSAEMIQGLSVPYELRLIEQPNLGVGVGRNVGAAAARNPIVVFLDDDIDARPGLLTAHATAHAETSTGTWIFGYFPPALGDSWIEQRVSSWWSDHFTTKSQPGHQWTMVDFVDGNSSVPVELFKQVGGFDEEFLRRRQDHEMGFRCLAAGVPTDYCSDAIGDHRASADLHNVLSNAYFEGRCDVLLAAKHPAAQHEMPLGHVAIGFRTWVRTMIAEHMDLDRSVRIAERLEALGQRSLWERFVSTVWTIQYRGGVRDGLVNAGIVQLPAAPPRRRLELALGEAPEPGLLHGVGNADLVFRRDDRVLASVPAVLPGAQWDWDDVVDRSVEALMPTLSLEPWAS